MEQNPSWQADSSLAIQPIFRVLWCPKIHYSGHNSRPLIPILSEINPADALSPSFLKVRFNIILSSTTRSTEWSHSSRFPHQNPARTSFHPLMYHMTHSYHSPWLNCPNSIWWGVPIMNHFIMRFSSTSCTSSLVHTKSPQLEHPHSMPLPFLWEAEFHVHTKQQVKLQFLIF